eukprot:CAMPEP_0172864806 /NCGR_PEP_ID=MMETSP1075-20121228/81045_1 /TAXON_ID=2916 /ORGANISM="Ceratium fusus, Strain PA161109" /LENGTH=75 /DNA_ID=CAMNT_0013713765 /DNA_START=62 /DNA_END=287 /DNA_ORIENTATION=+
MVTGDVFAKVNSCGESDLSLSSAAAFGPLGFPLQLPPATPTPGTGCLPARVAVVAEFVAAPGSPAAAAAAAARKA